jgi:hypothetical protein
MPKNKIYWVMTKKSDKHIVGKLALRKHLAVIDITFDENITPFKYLVHGVIVMKVLPHANMWFMES